MQTRDFAAAADATDTATAANANRERPPERCTICDSSTSGAPGGGGITRPNSPKPSSTACPPISQPLELRQPTNATAPTGPTQAQRSLEHALLG